MLDTMLATMLALLREFWVVFGPGGKLHPQYFLEHKGHLVIEVLLVVIITVLFLQGAFKPKPRAEDQLTEKEIDALVAEWRPDPLVPALGDDELPRERVVTANNWPYATVDGKQRVLNLASANMLNLGGTPEQMEAARSTVAKYGVGSCGPRGFYGTIDVHLELEAHLARFMGCPKCTIFAFDIATVASVIPACANRKDIIVADECCSYAVQQGMVLSRAAMHFFKHNDMADLEAVLQRIEAKNKEAGKPLCRKLIVVEGVYANTGDIAPLDQLFAIKEKYKYRLLVEETMSFGVLGPTGRGACEHFGFEAGINGIEVICASMSAVLGSVGGFCVGDPAVVEHQRLAGSGYVFSASLPPFLAVAANHALTQLEADAATLLPPLRRACSELHAALKKVPGITVNNGPATTGNSPVVHVRIAGAAGADAKHARAVLRKMADRLFDKHDLMVSVPVYSILDRVQPAPSLRLFLNAALTDKEVALIAGAFKAVAKELL